MSSFKWSEFTLRMPIRAGLQQIYDYWSTQQGMEKWFLRSCEYYSPDGDLKGINTPMLKNDTYLFGWHGQGDEINESGRILEANGRDELTFTFADPCKVHVHIYPLDFETMVELRQYNIPTDDAHKAKYHLGCSNGWTFYLANLKSVLENGPDLRNKRNRSAAVVNS